METSADPPPMTSVQPSTAARRFDPQNILWYFGTIAATIASVAVISDVRSDDRGLWVFIVSLAFIGSAAALSAFALRAGFGVVGGVLAAAAVTLFPAAAGAFEDLIGVWPSSSIDPFQHFEGVPFSLAALTIVAGLVAFWLVRFGFVLLPVAIATELAVQWFLPVFVTNPSANAHLNALLGTGFAFVAIGIVLDARLHRDPAFWWHVLGLFAIADGLVYYIGRGAVGTLVSNLSVAGVPPNALPTVTHHDTTWAWVTMLVIGAVLVLAAFPVRRATWGVFGVAAIYAPTLHYIDDWSGSWHVPLLMVFVGVSLVALGAILDRFGASWPEKLARPVKLGG